jgi:hypothetical protein
MPDDILREGVQRLMPALRTVPAARYVTVLREGGSMPAIVEGDDDGLYVLKFRGAGQGPKALIAELVAGEIARIAGLRVPEIVFMTVPPDLARTEPDAEIQGLLRASRGLNLGLDYLPGSITFDPLVFQPDAALASAIVWFDAFVCNVDRTARNTNMLMWHGNLWLIDHGAALYFHHAWNESDAPAANPFKLVKDHVLLPAAADLAAVDLRMKGRLSPAKFDAIVALIPDEWLPDDPGFGGRSAQRAAYRQFFASRLEASDVFVGEALRARSAYL